MGKLFQMLAKINNKVIMASAPRLPANLFDIFSIALQEHFNIRIKALPVK